MLVQTKHLMTAVWIQSSAILFTTELNKLFQKRQKIVILNYKTNISIILHLCHNHLILLFQSYDATDAKNQKLLLSTCCFAHFCIPRAGHLKSRLCIYFYTLPWSNNNNNNNSSRRPKPMNGTLQAVWPDWVIYWTMGNFLKPWQHLICPNLPHY